MNLFHLLIYFISIQGFFLSLFLFNHDRGNRTANRWLGGYVGSYSLFLLLLGTEQLLHREFPHVIGLGYPLIFLLGPAFFFYVKSYLGRKKTSSHKDAVHFVPFALSVLTMIPFFLAGAQTKIAFHESVYVDAEPGLLTVTWMLECMHVTGYSLFAFLIMLDTKRQTGISTLKEKHQSVFLWIFRLTAGNLFVWSTYILVFINFLLFGNINPNAWLNQLFIVSSSLFIYLTGYLGWRRPEIFSYASTLAGEAGYKYERSGLTDRQKQEILDLLLKSMEEEKIYLNPDLTLTDLGDLLNVSPNYISQVINEKLDRNFFEFVNAYRVQEAQRQLTDPANNHLTVLGIAEQSGFNSKSTFNKVFKEMTQTTPSQYRKEERPG